MQEEVPKEVLLAFTGYNPGLPIQSPGKMMVDPVEGGLINNSFKVSCELIPSFFLQQINKNVFTNPREVQRNYVLISEYAEYEFTGLRLPYPIFIEKGNTLYKDDSGNYWRAFEFIDNARSSSIAEIPAQAKDTATAFGRFTAAYDDFNSGLLGEVIPGFHNLESRYWQFEEALNGELYERIERAVPITEALKSRKRYEQFYEDITRSDEYPLRVMHHDAKISNILFDKETGKVICPVDLDTVMPGYFFSDLGDMIRSMASSKDENSKGEVLIRKNYYDAIIGGYLDVMRTYLTSSELKYIHASGLLIIYMQALRFLTDYLNGDIYYKTSYTEQNFDRAENQLILLNRLEDFLRENYSFSL